MGRSSQALTSGRSQHLGAARTTLDAALGKAGFDPSVHKTLLPLPSEPCSPHVPGGLESLEIPRAGSRPPIYVSSHCLSGGCHAQEGPWELAK